MVALVKPQFEVGPGRVGKGGIVRDEQARAEALAAVAAGGARRWVSQVLGETTSPITGRQGQRRVPASPARRRDLVSCPAMNVLVTGAAGFIGSHLCRAAAGAGRSGGGPGQLRRLLPARDQGAEPGGGCGTTPASPWSRGTCAQPADLERALAAGGRGRRAWCTWRRWPGCGRRCASPSASTTSTSWARVRLLEACRRARGRAGGVRLVLVGVRRRTARSPFRESDACAQPAVALRRHQAGGRAAAPATPTTCIGWPVTCLRFFTVLRAAPAARPGHPQVRRPPSPRGEPIELYGDGSTARDYTFIDDIVDGVVAAIDQQVAEPAALPHLQPGRIAAPPRWPGWWS